VSHYIPTKLEGVQGFKKGQFHLDLGGGFVRYFNNFGDIYEGMLTKLGKNGFGRLIKEQFCYIGYWKNDQFYGSGRKYFKGKLMQEGWFESMAELKGDFKMDNEERKYWEIKASFFIGTSKSWDFG